MEHIICLYKPVGASPLQLINHFRQQYPEYQNEKLGYAGRLDPMADGLVLVLVGDENKRRKIYEDLPKEYECEVLFGIATDTYDILGKITGIERIDAINLPAGRQSRVYTGGMQQIVSNFIGKQIQPYPPYSSQPVNGKPLYYWARKNKLDEIEIPTKNIEIYTIETLSQRKILISNLETLITGRIAKVIGDFRQEEILTIWKAFFKHHEKQVFSIYSFRISCSSGTYIRSFAHNLGKKLKTYTLALSITRTKIGKYNLQDGLKLDIL